MSWRVLVLAVALVAVLPPSSTVRAADDVLTPEELCALFTGEQLDTEAWSSDHVGICTARRGSLAEEDGTWLSVEIYAYGDAEEAAAVLLSSGVSASWTSVDDFGAAAFIYYNVEFFTYVLRGPYIIYGWAAAEQEGAAREVIAAVDEKLAALLEEEPADAGETEDPAPPEPKPSPDDDSIEDIAVGIMGTAFGTGEDEWWDEVQDRIAQRTGCVLSDVPARISGADEDVLRRCAEAADLTLEARDAIRGEFEDDEVDRRAVALTMNAMWLANLTDSDGEHLFPGMLAVSPVMLKLGRGAALGNEEADLVLRRFIALVAGRDLLQWDG